MCQRDLQPEASVSFSIAPTVGRDFAKLLASLYTLHPQWLLGLAEVTKEFDRSDCLHAQGRCGYPGKTLYSEAGAQQVAGSFLDYIVPAPHATELAAL